METLGDERDGWRPPSEVRNIVRDSTVEYLVQVGHVRGDLVVNLPSAREPADTAAEELARSVRSQWSAEVAARELGDTEGALALRWLARWGPSAPRGTGPDEERDGPGHAVRGDRIGGAVDTFLGLGLRRLLVLGGPGSGKSTLLALTTVLLAGRHLGDVTRAVPGDRGVPVPVLLTLESWDAEQVAFRDWLIDRLTEDHPGLPRVDGAHPARRLVRDNRVLALLDGLDELPAHRRGAVVRALNAAPRDTGYILACRAAEYRASADRLTGASDIEALPVGPRDAAAHLLRTADPRRHDQWGPVVDELAEHPEGPLAQALATPLMLWLVRRAHRPEHADPALLTDHGRFRTRADIEAHLLDAIVPAAFAPGAHDTERLHAPGRWHPGRARGWLAFLARELERRETTEFAWWRLQRTTVTRLLALPTLLVLGIALTESVLMLTRLVQDAYSDPVLQGILRIDRVERNYVLGGFLMATAVRGAAMAWFGERFWEPRRRANPFRAGAALRSVSRAASLRQGLRAAAVLLVPTAGLLLISLEATGEHVPAFAAQSLLGFTLAAPLMAMIAAPADTVDAATPDSALTSERRTAWLTLGLVAPLIGLGPGAHSLLTGDAAAEVAIAVIKGWAGAVLVLVALSPWCLWAVSKVWLALLGRVPWSLMEFLRDAHGAGLLQRYGGAYRFRHLRLQEHLAGALRTEPVSVPGPRQSPSGAPQSPSGARQSPPTAPTVNVPLQGPFTAGAPPRARRDPAGRTSPAPRLRDFLDQVPPLHATPGWRLVTADDSAYALTGRGRRLPLAHWAVCGAFAAVALMRTAANGNWDSWHGWIGVLFWLAFALLINLVALALPGVRMSLRIDVHGVTATMGRRTAAYAWDDVLTVAVRQTYVRGRNQRGYGPHVRLRPGAPEPPRVFRGRDGWWLVIGLNLRPAMPPDVVDALTRFSGGRWQG
ncbi:NACHT domain-containing protein [Streptomyces sp. NPDC055078]